MISVEQCKWVITVLLLVVLALASVICYKKCQGEGYKFVSAANCNDVAVMAGGAHLKQVPIPSDAKFNVYRTSKNADGSPKYINCVLDNPTPAQLASASKSFCKTTDATGVNLCQ